MIQDELRNFIEQNCSGKEPSDLIMEAIGRKIEQLGANSDEVLAFVDECIKGPTLEQKAEAASQVGKTVAHLKKLLIYWINNLYCIHSVSCHQTITKEEYDLHPSFYEIDEKKGKKEVEVRYQIGAIKAEAEKYITYDKEINSLLDEARNKEANAYYRAALEEIKRNCDSPGSFLYKNGINKAGKHLLELKLNYSDIATQQISDLETKIAEARNLIKEQEENKRAERERKDEIEREKAEEERKRAEEERKKEMESGSFLKKLFMLIKN
jgi:hypothetical protein